MKRLLLIAATVFMSFSSIAQTTITFDGYERQEWNENINKYTSSSEWVKDNSRMVINDAYTIFTHTTNTIESAYYVTGTDHIDGFYQYYVVSDVGNKYFFMFDLEKNLFKIISFEGDFMTIYSVKAIF